MPEDRNANWKAAVLSALQRYSDRHGSGQIVRSTFLTEELSRMVDATKSAGRTPAQTVSRILQELRDEGKLFFSAAGIYVINGNNIEACSEDFPDDVLENAAKTGALFFKDISTSDEIRRVRMRRGMAAVRHATLQNYGGCCALCDIADARLLVTSHIARWADCPEARGHLTNTICLCSVHDPLFETGYFVLSNEHVVIWRPAISSETIRTVAKYCTKPFSLPRWRSPAASYLQEHRTRVGLSISA